MSKKNLLITYNYLLHYRKPLFNKLCSFYNVTVLHSGKETVIKDDNYKEIIVPTKRIGPFYFQKHILREVKKNEYDYIIALFDLRWIFTVISIFRHNKKARFILWGAWFTKLSIANKMRIWLTKRADASIFYTHSSMQDFIDAGLPHSSLYVANNTVDVGIRIKSFEYENKFRFLFVGSMDKRKQNDLLIKAFNNIVNQIPENIRLTFIGDGKELHYLRTLTNDLNLNNRVKFLGRINDPEKLRHYYLESIISISYGQAGLSVLQALGFGVPFLTKKTAISGGEITNIRHKYNGVLCDGLDSLQENLVFAANNLRKLLIMGENAYNYYTKYCTIDNYVQGFRDAIEETRKSRIDNNNKL